MSKFNLNQPVPILLLGDAPDQKTGLGRLGNDLAWLLSSMPEFKVGYLGRGGMGRAKNPWAQYAFAAHEQWGESKIEDAWDDLSQGQPGIIFTLWDASRLVWFADPTGLSPQLQNFLTYGNFERWGYFMQDSTGIIPSQIPLECAEVFARYSRVLLSSKWGHQITKNSIQLPDVDWIPHGINRSVFQPQDRMIARSGWGVSEKEIVIGCVMSNTARKQWPVVLESIALMPGRPKLWIHTDRLVNYWNLNALAVEYGLTGDRIIFEDRSFSDKELAWRYSACDATVVISGGEGFCYPVAESLSCGIPVVTGEYGAAGELTDHGSIPPKYSVIDTSHNVRRALYSAVDVRDSLQRCLAIYGELDCTKLVNHLDWPNLGPVWRKWLRKGLV
jgi:glycosyltransferase involved in cell wall biosynthesis